jgi:hypothetical protein
MSSEAIDQILQIIEHRANSRPSAIEFEMAYQARVAIDRIRFAIRHTEEFGRHSGQLREAGIQLLDALDRLEIVDRRFQDRSRNRAAASASRVAVNGGSVAPSQADSSLR